MTITSGANSKVAYMSANKKFTVELFKNKTLKFLLGLVMVHHNGCILDLVAWSLVKEDVICTPSGFFFIYNIL